MKITFDGDDLAWEGRKIAPSVRTFGQMRPVLAHPEKETPLDPEFGTYYMYREPERFGSIRYDITRILPLDICGEFNKTYGHVHPQSKKGAGWAEVYEILSGEAHFLLQKTSQLGVQDAALLTGKKGDCLIVPPGYGHVTINPGKADLILANLVSGLFESNYAPFTHRRGGCVYETTDGKIVKNRNYGSDFELRQMTARKFSGQFGVYAPFETLDLLSIARKNPKSMEFLDKPELFF
jgi:glucose-6-phosphate isomerase